MQFKLEKNTSRKYHRIDLPAQLRINDTRYVVADWSIGGAQIVCPPGAFETGWQGLVKLILSFQDVDVAFDIQAKVTWSNGDKAGFSFENMSNKVKKILKTYVEASIEGQLGEAEGIISRIDGLEIPLDVENPFTDTEKEDFQKKFYWRSAVYWGAGLLMLTGIIMVFFYNLTQASSVRAIISVPLVDIDAPLDGLLASVNVVEGQDVKKGQLLYTLDDSDLVRSVDRQKQAVATAEKECLQLRVAIDEEKKAQSLYRSSADRNLSNLKAEHEALLASLQYANKELNRAQQLFSSGSISKSYLDEKRKTYDEDINTLRALEEKIEMARVNKKSSLSGKYMGSNGTVHGEKDVLNAQLEVKEAMLQEANATLRQLIGKLEKTKVTSPASGEVYSVKQNIGSYLKSGDNVITVRPSQGIRPWVLARFTYEEALGIAPGRKADVFLPSIGLHVTGHVQTLGHQALSIAPAASQDMEISLSEVPVKIFLDTDNPEIKTGLAAIVTIKASLASKLEAKFGRIL